MTSSLDPLWWPDFGKLLVCCSPHIIVQRNTIKHFLAIFLGSYTILAGLPLLFHGAQSTLNSVRCHQARSKMGRSVQSVLTYDA
jgi:hypothetical protein